MKAPIFLFGSGRCGSTLVQRAINAHPDVVMYGEHEGFLGPIANSYHKLTQTGDVERFIYSDEAVSPDILMGPIKDSNVDICWVNNFTREDVHREHRQLVLNLLTQGLDLDKVHWGFKEIRYRQGQHTLWFLRELFPDSKFIFLYRDPLDTLVSGLLAWENPVALLADPERLATMISNRIDGWTSKYAYLMKHQQGEDAATCVVRYEDLVADPAAWMAQIFELLDLDTPQLALDMFNHRVASTGGDPSRTQLVALVQQGIERTQNAEFQQITRDMGYARH